MRKRSKFTKNLTLVLLSAILSFSVFGFIFSSVEKANASTLSDGRLIPKTSAEYVDGLASPIASATDGKNYVIIKDSHSLVYYLESNGGYKTIEGFTSLGQVAVTDMNGEKEVWFSDFGSIYALPLKNLNSFKIADKEDYRLTGGNFFSVSDTHLISVFKEGGEIFKKGNYTTDKISLTGKVDGEKPVALNSLGKVFYYFDSQIVINSINDFGVGETFSELNPSSMIANDKYLFVISGNLIYKINIETKEKVTLSFHEEDPFELGKCEKPKSLSFKGENLLITDSEGSVQEFTVENDKLKFTGFAIAKGKTAFNRILDDASDVERYGELTAVLDSVKLTVIKGGDNFDAYSRNSFINLDLNYFEQNELTELPSRFALGKDYLLTTFTDNSASLIDVKTQELVKATGIDGVIKDACYQSGIFYILTTSNNAQGTAIYTVYKLVESETAFSPLFAASGYAERLTVDVFTNAYVSTGTNVIKHLKTDSYTRSTHSTLANVKKLCSDLGGNLFALSNNGRIYCYDNGWTESSTTIASGSVTAFSLSFDKKQVTILKNGQELVYEDLEHDNASITEIKIPNGYTTTGANAKVSDLKFYKVANGSNVYEVYKGETYFDYKGLSEISEEYLYLDTVPANGLAPEMLVLLGKDRPFLVNSKECSKTVKTISEVSGKKFITTGVCAYYLPVISRTDDYILTDQTGIRFSKGDVIDISKEFTFLDRTYYFINFTKDEKTYSAFLPENFTTDILDEAYTSYVFTQETVEKTVLYSDESLSNSLFEITKNSTVRVFSEKDDVLKVAVQKDGNWIVGYINADSIVNYNSKNVQSAIIIGVVFTVLCASAIFIILKKKRN